MLKAVEHLAVVQWSPQHVQSYCTLAMARFVAHLMICGSFEQVYVGIKTHG
jgi:hypothetical protein